MKTDKTKNFQADFESHISKELKDITFIREQEKKYAYQPGTYIPGSWNDNIDKDEGGNTIGAYVVKDNENILVKRLNSSSINTDNITAKTIKVSEYVQAHIISSDSDLMVIGNNDNEIEFDKTTGINVTCNRISLYTYDNSEEPFEDIYLNDKSLNKHLNSFINQSKIYKVKGTRDVDQLNDILNDANFDNIGDVYNVYDNNHDLGEIFTIDNHGNSGEKTILSVRNGDNVVLVNVNSPRQSNSNINAKSVKSKKTIKSPRAANLPSLFCWDKLDAAIDLKPLETNISNNANDINVFKDMSADIALISSVNNKLTELSNILSTYTNNYTHDYYLPLSGGNITGELHIESTKNIVLNENNTLEKEISNKVRYEISSISNNSECFSVKDRAINNLGTISSNISIEYPSKPNDSHYARDFFIRFTISVPDNTTLPSINWAVDNVSFESDDEKPFDNFENNKTYIMMFSEMEDNHFLVSRKKVKNITLSQTPAEEPIQPA